MRAENERVVPNLSKNMRNNENINLASQGVQDSNLMYYRIADTIEKLPPQKTLSFQEKPTLIPVHADIFGSKHKIHMSLYVVYLRNDFNENILTEMRLEYLPGLFMLLQCLDSCSNSICKCCYMQCWGNKRSANVTT